MKRALLFLLLVLPVYFFISLYFLDKEHFLCPIQYKRDKIIRSDGRGDGYFGAERNGNRLHKGVDLFAKIGASVLASRSGVVIAARQNNSMGKYVLIKHPGNIATLYGHLSKIYVNKFELVRQGQVIAAVGKTGNANWRSIQSHLHFEVRVNGIPQDPLNYLE